MNTNPSKTRFWRIVTSFLCCLRKKSPRSHLPPNPQDPEAQPPNPISKSEENHVSLEILPKNSREVSLNQDQPLSSPQPPPENNNPQRIHLPPSNLQKQAQNNPLENPKSEPNLQETTQKDVNLFNSAGVTNETAVPTNDQKSSLENLNNYPSHIQEAQSQAQPTSIPPNNQRPPRKKVTRPLHLQINPQEISVHSEKTFYSARSCLSQENNNDQSKTENPEPQNSHQRKVENTYPSAEADILQRRPKTQDLMDISKVSTKGGLNLKGFNNPSANYCFAHALLQILYGLPEFREKTKRLAGQEKSNEILGKLCELFESIETKAQAEIERTKEELIERIKQKNQGITIFQPSGGDSRVLFQVLADNISQGQPFKQNPIFSLFSTGSLIKQVSCKNCPHGIPKKFIENSLMINAREDLYFAKASSPRNFFQADSELRHCSICNERTPHLKEITLESLPKILALRIEDCSTDISPTVKPRKNLEFCDNRGRKKNYKFFGGVYNTKKGFDGVHSVAYIQETETGMVKFYNDFMVRSVSWEDIHGYAKLLFYFEENP